MSKINFYFEHKMVKCYLNFVKWLTISYLHLQALKTAKHIGALVYSEVSAKTSNRSVCDVVEVAALSSAGNKSATDSPTFRRNRSFIRRKKFEGMGEAKNQLRKEAAKSCVVMWRTKETLTFKPQLWYS